jgi:hypothetical protein
MKALFTLKSAINQPTVFATIALISLISVIYPGIGKAEYSLQTTGQNTKALVFEIKNQPKIQTQSSLSIQTIANQDPLPPLLQKYLADHNSPLAPYAADMVQLPNWKMALSISFVESNMCIHQVDNNCSGMGGAPGSKTWRKYATQLDWFTDLNNLLNKPIYADKYNTFEKMKGVYVQPGSPAWVHGAEKIYAQLSDLEEQAIVTRDQKSPLALANTGNGFIINK